MQSSVDNPSVLIIAGEASSGAYARRLLEHWKQSGTKVSAFGIGTSEMETHGFERVAKSEDIAVVGITEVFRGLSRILNAFNRVVDEAEKRKPEFALLMDLPDFNLRLAKKLKKLGIPVVYYISPQVWAWRTGRVKTIKKYVDQMLVLFPFEEEFYKRHGVSARFVGHPILDEIKPEVFDPAWRKAERARYGISSDRLVLGLMPGSRRGEISHMLVPQLMAAQALKKEFPDLQVMLLVAPTLNLENMKAKLAGLDIPVMAIKRDPFEMISLVDVVLCASGTATLMVALMKKPMVIIYIVSAITNFIGRRLIPMPKFFGLSNIVLETSASPELLQEQAGLDGILQRLRPLIASKAARAEQESLLAQTHAKLGSHGATQRVAEIVSVYLRKP